MTVTWLNYDFSTICRQCAHWTEGCRELIGSCSARDTMTDAYESCEKFEAKKRPDGAAPEWLE
jgi:hypothetical protein